MQNEVKRKVKTAERSWSGKIVTNYRERSKLFWMNISKVWNKRKKVIPGVKTLDWNIVQDDKELKESWKGPFYWILNAGRVKREGIKTD